MCNVTTHNLQVCSIDVVVECCRLMAVLCFRTADLPLLLTESNMYFKGNHFNCFYVFFALFSLEFRIL